MAKKPDLRTGVFSAAKSPDPRREIPEPAARSQPGPGREGKKVVAGHFDPAVARQLKLLALEKDTTVQNMLAEALNDLFRKHQRQPIA